jgi:iron(III) transport system substrate-binding protein
LREIGDFSSSYLTITDKDLLMVKRSLILALLLLSAVSAIACESGNEPDSLTLYSGRSETLIQPLIDKFIADTGIDVRVKYGSTSGTVALLLEEGDASPADVVLLQDAGAIGALAKEKKLGPIPHNLLTRVQAKYRSHNDDWVGISGRARTVIYNTEKLTPASLPDSIQGFTHPEWKARIGWAPTNGSFQAFVTALRITEGDAATKSWLEGIKANEPVAYPKNTAIVDAVGRGEVEVGFVNHYYLLRFLAEHGEEFPARNYYPRGDVGGMMNVAGVGIMTSSTAKPIALKFIDYLLSESAQSYFSDETGEYPLIDGLSSNPANPQLSDLDVIHIDLGNLDDLRGTLDLMRDVGILP